MSDLAHVAARPAAAEATPQAMIYAGDPGSETILRQCLADLDAGAVLYAKGGIDAAIADLARRASPRLLVVDICGAEDPVARVKQLAAVCEPSTGVVVIGDLNDVVLYRSLKNEGVVEYYFKPLVGNLVGRTCSAILTGGSEQPAPRTGKLVFVLGVRGGEGATTIATWAAWHLAEVRHRHVLLLDLDLSEGDAALQLDVMPNQMLHEALAHPERVDDLFLDRGLIHVTPKLDLLAGLEPLGDAAACREDAVALLLGKVLGRYRYVFVDLPSSLAPQLLGALRLPSICILVSDASLVAARDVARWRETIGADTADRSTLHVVNKAGANGGLPMDEFVRAVGKAPDVVIPYDREIGAASMLGSKGLTRNGAMSRALAPVLGRIAGEPVKEELSFLRRLFG